jgi:uncharacterized membrane protein
MYEHRIYGDTSPPSGQGLDQQTSNLLQQALPILSSGIPSFDPIQRSGVYAAQIKNYQIMKTKMPLLATFYDNEIRKLKAKKAAADKEISLKDEGNEATRQWRALGQAGVVVGILAGVAGIYFLIKKAK